MTINALRTGWPEQILAGRYSFRTRSRDGFADILAHGVRIISDDLIEPRPSTMLHVRIGRKPVMLIVEDTSRTWPQVPHGPKLCSMDPWGPLITLLRRPDPPGYQRSQWDPHIFDVLDNRLGAVIGTLERTGGFIRPVNIAIYDPSGRLVGHMVEPVVSLAFRFLLLGTYLAMYRLNFVVDGRRVARIRQVWHLFSREFRVDMSRSAGALDPRLVLACGLEELRRFSSY